MKIIKHTLLMATLAVAAVAQAAPQEQTNEELPPCPPAAGAQATTPEAQAVPETAPVEPAPAPALVPPKRHERHYSKVFAPNSVSLLTGAGVGNYFGAPLTGTTVDTGAAWDARVVVGTRSVIALEAGYVGAVNEIDVTGTSGRLNSNGLDGTFRLQLPYRVQPYIFSGVGYQHMSLDNPSGNPNVSGRFVTSDDQVTVPAGGGLAGYLGRHATLDLRGTYRFVGDNDITVMSARSLHQWVAQARVGYVF